VKAFITFQLTLIDEFRKCKSSILIAFEAGNSHDFTKLGLIKAYINGYEIKWIKDDSHHLKRISDLVNDTDVSDINAENESFKNTLVDGLHEFISEYNNMVTIYIEDKQPIKENFKILNNEFFADLKEDDISCFDFSHIIDNKELYKEYIDKWFHVSVAKNILIDYTYDQSKEVR
jgi:hypothetical protein